MSGPQNAVIGDNFGTDIPESQVNKTELDIEKKAAKYSQTEEFKKLKQHMEARIKHYQQFLPDGRPIAGEPNNLAQNWIVANTLVAEFQAVIDFYENAKQAVKDA